MFHCLIVFLNMDYDNIICQQYEHARRLLIIKSTSNSTVSPERLLYLKNSRYTTALSDYVAVDICTIAVAVSNVRTSH